MSYKQQKTGAKNSSTYTCIYPTETKFSLEFKFHYFVNGNLLTTIFFNNPLNEGLLIMFQILYLVIFEGVNLSNLSQVAKLYSVYVFIKCSLTISRQSHRLWNIQKLHIGNTYVCTRRTKVKRYICVRGNPVQPRGRETMYFIFCD